MRIDIQPGISKWRQSSGAKLLPGDNDEQRDDGDGDAGGFRMQRTIRTV